MGSAIVTSNNGISEMLSKADTISIVLVNWNSVKYLKKCIESIYSSLLDLPYEIVVVDGGSFDGCGAMLRESFPEVRFIQSSENIGFGRANNIGCEIANGTFLLLLNPDTEVVGDAITVLFQQLLSLTDAGIIGARLLNSDGSLQTSCVQSLPTPLNQALDCEFLRRRFPNWRLWGTAALDRKSSVAEVEAISGACMLMRRQTFWAIGGFGRQYFMYGEDMDLCHKVRAIGMKVYYAAEAQFVHHGGGSSKPDGGVFSNVMMRESILRYLSANRGAPHGKVYRVFMAVAALMRLFVLLPSIVQNNWARADLRKGSAQKWLAIFRWSIGREAWVNDFPGRSPKTKEPAACAV